VAYSLVAAVSDLQKMEEQPLVLEQEVHRRRYFHNNSSQVVAGQVLEQEDKLQQVPGQAGKLQQVLGQAGKLQLVQVQSKHLEIALQKLLDRQG